MKYFVGSYVFPYSWDIVAKTLWVRYPNSYSTHVLSEDTLDRYVEDGKLFSRRLLVKTNPLPKWAERFASKRYVSIVEESIVDPENETVVTYTRNVGYTHVMSVIERVVYTKADESALGSENVGTLADRSAWISSSLKGFCFAIEKFGIERFKHNTKKANAGYLEAIQNMLGQNNGGPGNPSSLPAAVSSSREKLRNAAARAKELRELAKSKAEPVYAACQQREDVPAA